MNYPEDARSLALATAFQGLVMVLAEAEVIEPERFLGHVAAGADSLMRDGDEIAAHALRDLVEPLADHFGFRSETSD